MPTKFDEPRFGRAVRLDERSREESLRLLFKFQVEPTKGGIKAAKRFNSFFNAGRRHRIQQAFDNQWAKFMKLFGIRFYRKYGSPVFNRPPKED